MKNGVVLDIENLSACYGDLRVLDQIRFQVHKGEILGLIGPNGAGKSTLIKVLSGVLKPSEGMVRLDGQDITEFNPGQRARLMAVVPQARQMGGAFTVEKTVLLGRTPYLGFLGKASEEDLRKANWAMQKTCVDHLAERRLAEISGGEQQRVMLARALAQETPVLLLDEPTNHLDLGYQIDFLNLISSLVQQEVLTVLMAMHDLNQVAGVADRVALLIDGQLAALGKPEQVITAANVSRAYRTQVSVVPNPENGTPLILPYN
jgi:iron complex transport system ATP-binding protein